MIAALYAAATLIALLLLQGLAWGRFSSASLKPFASLPCSRLPPSRFDGRLHHRESHQHGRQRHRRLGLLDVVFGSCATLVGALICWKLREHPKVAVLGPVIANAVIVPAYLPLLLQGLGYYTIPFTTIALDGLYLPMYLFGLVATGIGEALVMYVLGLPLLAALKRSACCRARALKGRRGSCGEG